MLQRLTVRRLRSLQDLTLELPKGAPLVLLGDPGCGRSAVLEALALLARLSGDRSGPLLERWPGGLASLRTVGVDAPLELEARLTLDLGDGGGARTVSYGLRLDSDDEGDAEIDREWLDADATEPGGKSLQVVAGDTSMLALWNRPDGSVGSTHEVLQRVRRALAAMRVFAPPAVLPRWALDPRETGASARDAATVTPDGAPSARGLDLPAVLYDLQCHHERAWEALSQEFQQAFPTVTRLEFPPDTTPGRLALGWRDASLAGARLSVWHMPDAMLAYLAYLTALLHPRRAPVLGFDEPSEVLGPALARRFFALCAKAASEGAAVVVTARNAEGIEGLGDSPGSLRRLCRHGAQSTLEDP